MRLDRVLGAQLAGRSDTLRLTLLELPTKSNESILKEGTDVVGLQFAGLGSLHLLADN